MSADDLSPLAGTEVHYLQSEHVGDEFKIFVGHCGDRADGAPSAVLYVSDANGLFASAVDIVRLLQQSAHVPPMLVVGIGYRMGGIADTDVIRSRDFSPTHDELYTTVFPDCTATGGGPKFLAFIRDELQPWVGANYNVDLDDSAYFGHSLGGLFGTWVLLTEPSTFRRYGIGSPSLWWHGHMMFDYERQYSKAHDDLPAKAFFGIGAREDQAGRLHEASRLSADAQAVMGVRYIDMVADTVRMVSALRRRRYPSLEIESAIFPDEFHITVAQLNLSRSLRYLFDAPR